MMHNGFLSQYFKAVSIKRLTSVEVHQAKSNQHEFNGTKELRRLFGSARLNDYPVTFMWLGGSEDNFSQQSTVTWYDARENHPTRTEWRLYFKHNQVMDIAKVGDLLIVAKMPNEQLFILVVQADSTFESQLLWLFGIHTQDTGFNFQHIGGIHDPQVDFAARYILEEIGIPVHVHDIAHLDSLLEPYVESGFPTTREFSALARQSVPDANPLKQPDLTLLRWMEQEEKLFKRLESFLVAERLEQGFYTDGHTDVGSFIQYSLSVHNRRKARVGYALEHHLQEIFTHHGLSHIRGATTENKSKPDFLFPGLVEYRDESFPSKRLTMLGAKSTCKDRWRQVLSEANRIQHKHLLTLEPSISENQTNEMQTQHLQLILPQPLHTTYSTSQQQWLMDLEEFIGLVKERA